MKTKSLSEIYGKNTQLFDLRDCEVDSSSSPLGLALREAGYDESPRRIINQLSAWGNEIWQIEAFVNSVKADLALASI